MTVINWLSCFKGEIITAQYNPINFMLAQQRFLMNSPPVVHDLVVNSEPQTGALPSVRFFVGLVTQKMYSWSQTSPIIQLLRVDNLFILLFFREVKFKVAMVSEKLAEIGFTSTHVDKLSLGYIRQTR